MKLDTATKSAVRHIVGRFHVATTDDAIRADMRRRTAPRHGFKGATQKQIAAIEAYAIKVHRENQSLYNGVMLNAW